MFNLINKTCEHTVCGFYTFFCEGGNLNDCKTSAWLKRRKKNSILSVQSLENCFCAQKESVGQRAELKGFNKV